MTLFVEVREVAALAAPVDDHRAAAVMLLMVNLRMRGNIDYVIAALWALIAVYVKQSGSDLPGAQTAAWVALGIGALLALQTVMLRRKYPGGLLPNPGRAVD